MKKKICMIASSGGHFEQLLMLTNLKKDFDLFYVTEKTQYTCNEDNNYYIHQVNRNEAMSILWCLLNVVLSLRIMIKEKHDVIISTGVLATIPMFLIGKLLRKKLIYIESFAKVNSPTLTGKFLYKFVDLFIVQWEPLKKEYPKAIFLGSIY